MSNRSSLTRGVIMNKKLWAVFLIFLFAIIAGFVLNNKMKIEKLNDEQYKIKFGIESLDLVFPTYYKIKNTNGEFEPDLNMIAKTLNTVQEKVKPTRLEPRWGQVVSVPFTPYSYRVGKPDGPKQIVFIYEKLQQKIRVEAYGDDLAKPVTFQEFPCCHW